MSETFEESKGYVKDAAYIFCMEGLMSMSNGAYDNFMDFLMTETDQRWILPHYFDCLFNEKFLIDKAFENLALFLYIYIDDESRNYLLKSYAQDTHDLLKKSKYAKDIEKLFAAYNKLRALIESGLDTNSDEFRDSVPEITDGVKGAQDWFQ